MNWDNYENFQEDEFRCSHSKKCHMDESFMNVLQSLRSAIDKPFVITSGYRDKTHPIEAKKATAGEHTLGKAADIACRGEVAYDIIKYAPLLGFTRIGVSQKGDKRYIHLGIGTAVDGLPSPRIWSY